MAAKSQAINWGEEKKVNEKEKFWIILTALFSQWTFQVDFFFLFNFSKVTKIGKPMRKYKFIRDSKASFFFPLKCNDFTEQFLAHITEHFKPPFNKICVFNSMMYHHSQKAALTSEYSSHVSEHLSHISGRYKYTFPWFCNCNKYWKMGNRLNVKKRILNSQLSATLYLRIFSKL